MKIKRAAVSPVVLWAGWPFFARGWASLVNRKLNMFTLIAMGVGVAYVYSLAALFAPDAFPPALRGMGGAPPVYFEAAAVIIVLVLLGQVLELSARERTSGAIRALIDLTPKMARRVRDDGTDEDIHVGHIAIGDRLRVRPGEKMLTGDNRTTALAVAKRLGIDDVEAEVAPSDKARVVQRLRQGGHVVAMAGDGVNDAPALAAADVGIAMGAGADVAIESAGVTLLRGDLMGLVRARTRSRAVMRNIRQNLFFAFAYNAVGVPIAAGLLYPAFHLLLSPALAAAAMALSSVSVITNALRLRTIPLHKL